MDLIYYQSLFPIPQKTRLKYPFLYLFTYYSTFFHITIDSVLYFMEGVTKPLIQQFLKKLFSSDQSGKNIPAAAAPQEIYLFQTDQTKLKEIIDSPFPSGKAHGYVYFVQEHMTGTFKIGKTKNIEKRMNVFGVQLPFKNELIFLIKSGNHHQTEVAFHRYFANKRLEGEWFALSKLDLEWVRSGNYTSEIRYTINGVQTAKFSDASSERLTTKQIEYAKSLIAKLGDDYEIGVHDTALSKKDFDRLLVYFRYKNDGALKNLVKSGVIRKRVKITN